jgi:heme/copper-type cytochrome/quinol oxidase subunit 2
VRATLGATALSAMGPAFVGLRSLWASAQTDLQQTNALVWVMIALSAVGAIITFAFLIYALWRYRDPKVKNRRYG